MQEILILSLLIGGLSHLTKTQGGLRFLINLATRFVHRFSQKKSKQIAEIAIASIVSACDICAPQIIRLQSFLAETQPENLQKNMILILHVAQH